MIGINLDYVIINILVNVTQDWDNFRTVDSLTKENRFSVRLEQYGTKIFRNVAKVYFKGAEFGTMLFEPYDGSCLDQKFGQFQIKNNFLYIPLHQLKDILQDFSFQTGIEFTGFNRLDIAVDGSKDLGHFASYMYDFRRHIRTKDIAICGRIRDLNEYGDTTGEIFGFSYGSRSSDRYIRFYNKSKEMILRPKKHIYDYWKYVLNFEPEKETIYRFEIQLNRRFVRDIIDVWRVFDYNFLVSMFQTSTRYFFDIRENTGINRVTNMPKLDFLRTNFLEYLDCKKNPRKLEKLGLGEFYMPVRAKETEQTTIQQDKILIKKMFFRYMSSNQELTLPLFFINEIFEKNVSYYFDTFFMKKRDYWVQEFKEKHNKSFSFCAYSFHFDLKFIADQCF